MAKTSRLDMRIDAELLAAVDRARGDVSRAVFVARVLGQALAGAGEVDRVAVGVPALQQRGPARRQSAGEAMAAAKVERDRRVAERGSVSPSLRRFMDGQS